jgi:glyoxylase-like metal-dependent hydrolase (beta-lactamase superfamily II)
LRRDKLRLRLVLETCIHLDHLSAGAWLRERTGAEVYAGCGTREVQRLAERLFGRRDLRPDGGDFDHLLDDGEILPLGNLQIQILAFPGLTPADIAYRVQDDLFLGDLLPCPGAPEEILPGADGQARCASGQDTPAWQARLHERFATIDNLLAAPPPDPDGFGPYALPPLSPPGPADQRARRTLPAPGRKWTAPPPPAGPRAGSRSRPPTGVPRLAPWLGARQAPDQAGPIPCSESPGPYASPVRGAAPSSFSDPSAQDATVAAPPTTVASFLIGFTP